MIIIDGDLLVFKAGAYWEDKFTWDDGPVTQDNSVVDSHFSEAVHMIEDRLASYLEYLNDREYQIAFSSNTNFRKLLWPEYKRNRDPSKKPQALKDLIAYVKEKHPTIEWKDLEADDVLGILCSENPEWVAVTEDKDQATVPGKWWNPRHPELGIRTITRKEADYNHLIQTITGDSSDGYKGIPGVGPKGAVKILNKAKEDFLDPWCAVVDAYVGKGLTKDDALMNARMAFILRVGYYDMETGSVVKWLPTKFSF
jgi:DNA polymerase-1